ncbi:MAG: YdcF family protein [Alphaproteobacteria bacterium CG_4_9_14_3_um_filter_47_13]|nr:MAG: YdcF family protein [Alphaproteobacteria bacterium CG_4_9_14_3_um_filter_47_13]
MLLWFRFTAIIFMTVLLFWVAGFIGFYVNIKGMAAPYHGTADSIIVLTGGPDRINSGLDLFASGKAPTLFISGVNEKVSTQELVNLWRKDAQDLPCCIILGHKAHNTFENAVETKNWMADASVQSALLLTTDYHMPRAWLEFTTLMPEIDFYPHAIPAPKTDWILVAGEYNKTLYTLLRLKLACLKI